MSPEERALLQRFGVVTFQTLPNIAVYSLFQGVLCALYYLSAILLVKNGLASMTKRIMLGLSILNVLLIFVPWAAIVAQFARMTIQVLITSAGTIDLDLFDSVNAGAFVPSLLVDWSWWLLVLINDSLVVWRAWVLYPMQRWVMIVPCALLVGSAGISVAAFVFEVLPVSNNDLRNAEGLPNLLNMLQYILTLATNVTATCLVVFRLWNHRRFLGVLGVNQRSTSLGQRVMIVLAESGLTFSVLQAVVLGVSFTDSTSTAVSIFAAMVSALFHTGVAAYTPIVILLVSKQKTVAETFHMTEELRGQGLLDVEITSKRRSAPLQGEMS